MVYLGLSCFLLHVFVVFGSEITFELPDNEKQCFYEELEKDVKFDIDFQVSYSESLITSVSDVFTGCCQSGSKDSHLIWCLSLVLGKRACIVLTCLPILIVSY